MAVACSLYSRDRGGSSDAAPAQAEADAEHLQEYIDGIYKRTEPLLKDGKFDEALSVWKNALTDAGDNEPLRAELLMGIGDAYKYDGELEKAEEYYGKSVEAKSPNAGALGRFAEISLMKGDADKASQYLKEARAADAEFVFSRTRRGIVQKKIEGDIEGALKTFIEVINSGLLDPVAYNEAGVILLMNLNMPDEAAMLFKTALVHDPDNAQYINNLANAYMMAGDFDTAIEHYEKALALSPDDALTNGNLAITLINCGKFDGAKKYAQRAYELDPKVVQGLSAMGFIAGNEGDPDKAIEFFQKILDIDPNHAVTISNMAHAYAQKGDKETSQKYIDKLKKMGLYDDSGNADADEVKNESDSSEKSAE